MYNEKILLQLNQLQYLQTVKKCNVNAMSKKNPFGDMIKFYAQISKDDVIQKISYKASGCTHFLVFGNYFCSLVEGKTIKDALKIDITDLETLDKLDDSKKHVVDIILNTFALLVKKYRKGIESGTIKPVDVEKTKATPKSKKTPSKNTSVDSTIKNNIEKEEKASNPLDSSDISNLSNMINKMEKSLKKNLSAQDMSQQNKTSANRLSSLLSSYENIKQNEKKAEKSKVKKESKTKEDKKLLKEQKKEAKKQKIAKKDKLKK